MLFFQNKFRHIEQNNTTLCTHFSNLSPVRIWHLLTQQNIAAPNLYSTNCSVAPSVVWNPHFILVNLVYISFPDFSIVMLMDSQSLDWFAAVLHVGSSKKNIFVSLQPPYQHHTILFHPFFSRYNPNISPSKFCETPQKSFMSVFVCNGNQSKRLQTDVLISTSLELHVVQ